MFTADNKSVGTQVYMYVRVGGCQREVCVRGIKLSGPFLGMRACADGGNRVPVQHKLLSYTDGLFPEPRLLLLSFLP